MYCFIINEDSPITGMLDKDHIVASYSFFEMLNTFYILNAKPHISVSFKKTHVRFFVELPSSFRSIYSHINQSYDSNLSEKRPIKCFPFYFKTFWRAFWTSNGVWRTSVALNLFSYKLMLLSTAVSVRVAMKWTFLPTFCALSWKRFRRLPDMW